MIWGGLSVAQQRRLAFTLTQSHRVKVRVNVQDAAGHTLADISSYLDDGQVNIDGTADNTRGLSISLHDPNRAIAIATNSPSDMALGFDRLMHVVYEVEDTDFDIPWVNLPVFTGPMIKLDRDGDMIDVECQGMEWRGGAGDSRAAAFAPLTLHKNMLKTDAIRKILRHYMGITRFDFVTSTARLPKSISIGREMKPWQVARHIANGMGLQLFFDGAGTCRLRRRPGVVGFTFTDTHHVVKAPQISQSSDLVNAVYVYGANPTGPKTPIHYPAIAPATHPLSPTGLGGDGPPIYLAEFVHDDNIRTWREARIVGERHLEDGLQQGYDVSFDSVPVPMVDPADKCLVSTREASTTFRLLKASIPLKHDGDPGPPMTVGYHRNLLKASTTTRRRRRNRR